MQVKPVYYGSEWADKLFLLLTNLDNSKVSLRIDVVSASQPLDSAVNIARINTNAHAAYNAAKFAEIDFRTSANDKVRHHFFATLAYQSFKTEANYLTISEAIFKDDVWQNDRSQAFFVLEGELADSYLSLLGIKKNRQPKFS